MGLKLTYQNANFGRREGVANHLADFVPESEVRNISILKREFECNQAAINL